MNNTFEEPFKSGFITLAGRPNVGKSSLLNAFLGQKIAITSEKPQTTRNQLKGILTGPSYQIIWIDTPGLHRPFHRLGNWMIQETMTSFSNTDLILWVLDAGDGFTKADAEVAKTFGAVGLPVYIAWNKMDLIAPRENGQARALPDIPGFDKVFKVSAVMNQGITELLDALITALPNGPVYYPLEYATDQPERFIAAELIREQVLKFTEEEVPHAVAVAVEEMKERPNNMMYIQATIYVERNSQKGIIIGANGARLKKIGLEARVAVEALLDQPVYLSLWVKVRKNWRNDENALKEFGYGE